MSHALSLPAVVPPPAVPAVDPRSLARLARTDLDRLFATLPAAALDQVQGHLRGSLMGVSGIDRLPLGLRTGLYALLRTPLNVWRGKRFEGTRGVNVWGVGDGQLSFAAFTTKVALALDGSGLCVQLDYDVPENPLVLRGIVGEVRSLGPGLFLARMNYRVGSGRTCVLYFSMEH